MDEDSIDTPDGATYRAQLHYRSALRRLEENKTIHAIATMFDAIEYALKSPLLKEHDPQMISDIDSLPELAKYHNFNSQIVNSLQTIQDQFELLMEDMETEVDVQKFMQLSDEILEELNLLPFNLDELPPENPGIY